LPETWRQQKDLNGDMRRVAEPMGVGNALKPAQRLDETLCGSTAGRPENGVGGANVFAGITKPAGIPKRI
jgi:hypothetical protein